jgi:putative glycosyltransferase (TIGR04372 family)
LNFLKKYIILTPFEYTIGNAAEHIFYGLLTARITKRKLILLVRQPGFLRRIVGRVVKARLTNREIFMVQSEGVIIPSDCPISRIAGKLLDLAFIPLQCIDRVLRKIFKKDFNSFFAIPTFGHSVVYNPARADKFSWEVAKSYDWNRALTEGVPVYIAKNKESAARGIRSEMGLPADCWYVGLHVRERGFYNEPRDAGAYRCADIDNYLEAIKAITARGGWVVRFGDDTMKPLPDMERVIDYPFTPYKSDLMDLYLIQNCSLYIGMDSGIWDVAHMFQKNILLVNLTGWLLAFPPRLGDLATLKHFYSRSRRRFLSVRECLEEPHTINYHFMDKTPSGDDTDYIIVENTSTEIEALVQEKLDQREGDQYDELQKLFMEKRREQIKRWLVEDPYLVQRPTQSYRLSTRYFYQGTLSRKFLADNWEFGKHLEQMTDEFRAGKLTNS